MKTRHAYSRRQRARRDVAAFVVWMSVVFLAAVLVVAGREFDWSIIRLFAWISAIPLLWAFSVLLSRKESILVDLERRVVRSGEKKEEPLSRLAPILVERDFVMRLGKKRSRGCHQVVAGGWNKYVLYESRSRKKAERWGAKLSDVVAGGAW